MIKKSVRRASILQKWEYLFVFLPIDFLSSSRNRSIDCTGARIYSVQLQLFPFSNQYIFLTAFYIPCSPYVFTSLSVQQNFSNILRSTLISYVSKVVYLLVCMSGFCSIFTVGPTIAF